MQFFNQGLKVTTEVKGYNLLFEVVNVETSSGDGYIGILTNQTQLIFEKAVGSGLVIKGVSTVGKPSLFKPNFNFSDLGIGGVDRQFQDIFRRAFTSRVFPPKVAEKLGLRHLRGILLYGPPGTGKTMIARKIGLMLNSKEPKKVNGPEILNKYVGEGERNIRDLFADAEAEQRERGEESDLHVIIFDELDAICKQRGQSGSQGFGDTIVNQLLSKIQGVDELHNILIIGMTNRMELIDEALLRPGRIELHIEIGLPDEAGRHQIFMIHTKTMRDNRILSPEVDLHYLAKRTKNYTGADIEGLVSNAKTFAMGRHVDFNDLSKTSNPEDIMVTAADFEAALAETKAAYGVPEETIGKYLGNGIVEYGNTASIIRRCNESINLLRESKNVSQYNLLLEGPPGCGKTALAATVAKNSDIPFVRVISPNDFIGDSESYIIARIAKIFTDAYKSPLSMIIIDQIENLLEYVAIGPRFSANILKTISRVLNNPPEQPKKLFVLGTTSSLGVLRNLSLEDRFHETIHISLISEYSELESIIKHYHSDVPDAVLSHLQKEIENVPHFSVTMKRVIIALENAYHNCSTDKPEEFCAAFFESLIPDCDYSDMVGLPLNVGDTVLYGEETYDLVQKRGGKKLNPTIVLESKEGQRIKVPVKKVRHISLGMN